jgi:acetate---CoA ligase (ADP-forming)
VTGSVTAMLEARGIAYPRIGGQRCLPALTDLPEPADLVPLAVPDATLEEQLGLAASTKARSA